LQRILSLSMIFLRNRPDARWVSFCRFTQNGIWRFIVRQNGTWIAVAVLFFAVMAAGIGAQGVCDDPPADAWRHGRGDGTGISDPAAQLEQLSEEYEVDLAVLEALFAEGYGVGSLRMALGLAEASGSTLDEIIALVADPEEPNWGQIAASLGIEPGSEEFRAIVGRGEGRGGAGSGEGTPGQGNGGGSGYHGGEDNPGNGGQGGNGQGGGQGGNGQGGGQGRGGR
jgi:hypothetical protein